MKNGLPQGAVEIGTIAETEPGNSLTLSLIFSIHHATKLPLLSLIFYPTSSSDLLLTGFQDFKLQIRLQDIISDRN